MVSRRRCAVKLLRPRPAFASTAATATTPAPPPALLGITFAGGCRWLLARLWRRALSIGSIRPRPARLRRFGVRSGGRTRTPRAYRAGRNAATAARILGYCSQRPLDLVDHVHGAHRDAVLQLEVDGRYFDQAPRLRQPQLHDFAVEV